MKYLPRLLATVSAVAATAMVLTAPEASAAPAITWVTCPMQVDTSHARCGEIQVPLNYDDPNSELITVGFVQRKATGRSQGTVFVNPGGPGGDAYSYTAPSAELKEEFSWDPRITSHFDMVGVQPRGLPGSTPLECLPDIDAPEDHTRPKPNIDPMTAIYSSGAAARALCATTTSEAMLNSITSENVVKDFDQVRQALGLNKINLIGLSYGTYLMSRYATLYPEHTDKVVLDSLMDPSLAWNGVLTIQKPYYIARLHEMFAWIAAHDDIYHLGKTPYQVYEKWARRVTLESGAPPAVAPPALTDADMPGGNVDLINATNPFVTQMRSATAKMATGHGNISGFEITARMVVPDARKWPQFARALNGTDEVPSPDNFMEKLAEKFGKEQSKKYLLEVANSQLMQSIIFCNENATPPNLLMVPQSLYSQFVLNDFFAGVNDAAEAGRTCANVAPVSHIQEVSGNKLAVKPLAIQSVRDPQTPLPNSKHLANAMDATTVIVDDGNHGHIAMGNPAVDGIVATYLTTGTISATSAPGVVIDLNS